MDKLSIVLAVVAVVVMVLGIILDLKALIIISLVCCGIVLLIYQVSGGPRAFRRFNKKLKNRKEE